MCGQDKVNGQDTGGWAGYRGVGRTGTSEWGRYGWVAVIQVGGPDAGEWAEYW